MNELGEHHMNISVFDDHSVIWQRTTYVYIDWENDHKRMRSAHLTLTSRSLNKIRTRVFSPQITQTHIRQIYLARAYEWKTITLNRTRWVQQSCIFSWHLKWKTLPVGQLYISCVNTILYSFLWIVFVHVP